MSVIGVGSGRLIRDRCDHRKLSSVNQIDPTGHLSRICVKICMELHTTHIDCIVGPLAVLQYKTLGRAVRAVGNTAGMKCSYLN